MGGIASYDTYKPSLGDKNLPPSWANRHALTREQWEQQDRPSTIPSVITVRDTGGRALMAIEADLPEGYTVTVAPKNAGPIKPAREITLWVPGVSDAAPVTLRQFFKAHPSLGHSSRLRQAAHRGDIKSVGTVGKSPAYNPGDLYNYLGWVPRE